jgi:hypothetical protein
MTKSVLSVLGLSLIVLVASGCGQQAATPSTSSTASAVDGATFRLASEPAGAQDVIKVREESADADEVVIVGRIGGESPWIEDRAAFSIVDSSLRACSDIPGDACETPWDYCCETDKLPRATALVKVVDADGNLVKAGARELLNVNELSTVVVQGTAQRDDQGNLTVLARGVFVRKK